MPDAQYFAQMVDDTTWRLGTPVRTFVGERGTISIWRPGTGLLISRIAGHLGIEAARELDVIFRRQVLEDGWNLSFNDWSRMEDYDAESRAMLTQTTLELLPSVRAAHFLIRSRVVSFGVQAANIVLRRLTLHPTEESFQRELIGALAKRGTAVPSSAGGMR
jgi:hypothetical protein